MQDIKPSGDPEFVLKTLSARINDRWTELNSTTLHESSDFWDKLSLMRKDIKDFFTAFGTLDKKLKVNNWKLLHEVSLISTIIEG